MTHWRTVHFLVVTGYKGTLQPYVHPSVTPSLHNPVDLSKDASVSQPSASCQQSWEDSSNSLMGLQATEAGKSHDVTAPQRSALMTPQKSSAAICLNTVSEGKVWSTAERSAGLQKVIRRLSEGF